MLEKLYELWSIEKRVSVTIKKCRFKLYFYYCDRKHL